MLATAAPPLGKLRTLPLLLLALIGGVFAGRASGQTVVYSNLSTSSANPIQNYTNIVSLGQSFTPSASGFISSLSLNLETISPNAGPVYAVQLWSDSGGSTHLPATLLATLVTNHHWNTDFVSPADSSHLVTFSAAGFAQNYSLISGTIYWVAVATTDGPNKSWGVSSTSAGATALFALNGSQWTTLTLSGALGAQISVVSAIPEPGTYATLAGIAMLGFAAYSRRRWRGEAKRVASGIPKNHPVQE